MSAKSRQRSYVASFQLLAGERQEEYSLEPALRLFQVKYWLTSNLAQGRAFLLSARMFGAAFVQQELERGSGSTSKRLVRVLRDEDNSRLFNHIYPRGELFTTKKDHVDLHNAVRVREKNTKHMAYWIELARVRALLAQQFHYSTKSNAELFMKMMKENDAEYDKRIYGSQAGEQNPRSKKKAIFLLAASLVCPSLLKFTYREGDLLGDLARDRVTVDDFRSFCGLSCSLHILLKENGSVFINRALGEIHYPVPTFERVPEDWALSFVRPIRLQAEENKRGKTSRIRVPPRQK